jgi:Zn-dependent peptidase ImmA (M78 family)
MKETMIRPRYALARKRAADLIRTAGVKRPPVPIEALAAKVGAIVRYEPFAGKVSGLIHRSEEAAVIGVNSLHPKTRRRFTIAHELGHLLLHKRETLHVDEHFPIAFRNETSSRASSPTEIEANQFAAELLMPSELVLQDVRKLPPETQLEDAVVTLARLYQVSEQAMAIKLSVLGVVN